MDYRIRRNTRDLDSTGYMEIGPGQYQGKHWQDGFLFVWEDAFGMAEGILSHHLPEYNHFGINEMPRAVGLAVTAEWRDVAGRLPRMTSTQAHLALHLQLSYGDRLDEEVVTHREAIAALLRTLADACERFYDNSAWVCILGV